MKLIRCGAPGQERAGVLLDDGHRLEASAFAGDCDEACLAGNGAQRVLGPA